MTSDQGVWAVTSFFNPGHFQRRAHNYRIFKEALAVPLVTVELSCTGEFELRPEDAEILIQLQGDCSLWQKERLLNVAIGKVPRGVAYIAWLDCDIVLERRNWPEAGAATLKRVPIAQVFSRLYDLERDVLPADIKSRSETPTSPSVAFKMATGTSTIEDFRPTSPRRLGLGFGWVALRELLDRHGLYDAFITGSGDRAIACAAWGRYEDAIAQVRLSRQQQAHYLNWAVPFHNEVRGRVGVVEGNVFHLWHGDLENRGYQRRHVDFVRFNFDPARDLTIGPEGCWRLSERQGELRAFMFEYFRSRKEDG